MMDSDSLRRELAKHILTGVDDKGGRELGNGAYGVVKTVWYEGNEYACKSFHDSLMSSTTKELDPNKVEKAFVEECRNAVTMNHSNIVRTIGLFFPQNASFPSIVMELLPHCLGKTKEIPSCLKPFILADIAKGLHYLHSRSIMHRDLTAYNVLLTTYFTAKISDFGQAKVISPSQIHQHSVVPGNVIYMPPEASITDSQAIYDYSLDVFSFGVLILHTYLERVPKKQEVHIPLPANPKLYTRLPPLDYFSEDIEIAVPQKHVLRSLLERCLEEEPSRRPSSEELDTEMSEMIKDEHSIINGLKHWCVELKYGNLKRGESIDREIVEKERQKFEEERVEFEKERMNFLTLLQQKEDNESKLQKEICLMSEDQEKLRTELKESKAQLEEFEKRQREQTSSKKDQSTSKKEQPATRGYESRLNTLERHQDDFDQIEEMLVSMRDPEKIEASMAEKKKKKLEDLHKENAELWGEVIALREKNKQLKQEKANLEERLQNGQGHESLDSASVKVVGEGDWPPTLQICDEEVSERKRGCLRKRKCLSYHNNTSF